MQKCKVLYGTSVDVRAGIQKMGFEHVSMRLNEIERVWTRLNELERVNVCVHLEEKQLTH